MSMITGPKYEGVLYRIATSYDMAKDCYSWGVRSGSSTPLSIESVQAYFNGNRPLSSVGDWVFSTLELRKKIDTNVDRITGQRYLNIAKEKLIHLVLNERPLEDIPNRYPDLEGPVLRDNLNKKFKVALTGIYEEKLTEDYNDPPINENIKLLPLMTRLKSQVTYFIGMVALCSIAFFVPFLGLLIFIAIPGVTLYITILSFFYFTFTYSFLFLFPSQPVTLIKAVGLFMSFLQAVPVYRGCIGSRKRFCYNDKCLWNLGAEIPTIYKKLPVIKFFEKIFSPGGPHKDPFEEWLSEKRKSLIKTCHQALDPEMKKLWMQTMNDLLTAR
jgi:hypothetical protein